MAEFLRYSDLIRRERVKNELISERFLKNLILLANKIEKFIYFKNLKNREILISQLETFTKQMTEELNSYVKSTRSTPKGKNMPSTIGVIVWITQSENTVRRRFN